MNEFLRFRYSAVRGICVLLIFISFGAWLVVENDIRKNKNWFAGQSMRDTYIIKILEPPVEKPKTYKTTAEVIFISEGNKWIRKKGKMLVYFNKPVDPRIGFGSTIIFKKVPDRIKKFIPSFNYERYCLFAGITHQVFLKNNDFKILNSSGTKTLKGFIFKCREDILFTLKKNIRDSAALGLAEALLIGYKNDLDKQIVQHYTNTGVVHIIAISGLHLGLIYLLLAAVTGPLKRLRMNWIRTLVIIAGLWIFSLLAGAQPSILRSALMFTCIALGDAASRKTSVYNSLAVSAFIIVCINPFSLWDIGFQLSYSALLSILIFMRPVYNLFYIKNKLLDILWKMNAVTLAAQVLTLPLCIYHFGQFPNYFLLSNFIAVPLSSFILLGEIFLCIVFFTGPFAVMTGKILSILIIFMNNYIGRVASLPWSIAAGLEITFLQLLSLYGVIISVSVWLLEKKPVAIKYALCSIIIFVLLARII